MNKVISLYMFRLNISAPNRDEAMKLAEITSQAQLDEDLILAERYKFHDSDFTKVLDKDAQIIYVDFKNKRKVA